MRSITISARNTLASLLVVSWAFSVHGAFAKKIAPARLELVQTAPLETSLEVPGIPTTDQVWLKMIQSAHSSIDIEQFYISDKKGQSLEPILKALRNAATARSVKVRIIVDRKFYKHYAQIPDAFGKLPNVSVRIIDFSPEGGIQHSKYFIVDRTQAYVGSANWDWRALSHIHEVGLHVINRRIAGQLEKIFNKDWKRAGSKQKPPKIAKKAPSTSQATASLASASQAPLLVVASPEVDNPKGVAETLPHLLQMIRSAKHLLQVQVYEYSTKIYHKSGTWHVLDQALRQAAKRGVHVQLMVDQVSMKSGGPDLRALAQTKNFEVRTVKIPTWSGGVIPYARLIHSKYMIVDGRLSWVGSENWSKSYFYSCRNVGLISSSRKIASGLTRIFNKLWTSSATSPVTAVNK